MSIYKVSAAIVIALGLVSCGPSKEKMKKEFIQSCMSGVGVQADPKMQQMMQEYCECSAEKAVNKFSAKEFAEFNKMSQTEMQAKLMPVIQGCLDELTQKAQTYQQSKAQAPAAQ